jgi:hypothetical protein
MIGVIFILEQVTGQSKVFSRLFAPFRFFPISRLPAGKKEQMLNNFSFALNFSWLFSEFFIPNEALGFIVNKMLDLPVFRGFGRDGGIPLRQKQSRRYLPIVFSTCGYVATCRGEECRLKKYMSARKPKEGCMIVTKRFEGRGKI